VAPADPSGDLCRSPALGVRAADRALFDSRIESFSEANVVTPHRLACRAVHHRSRIE
jgi:hypothetical protein